MKLLRHRLCLFPRKIVANDGQICASRQDPPAEPSRCRVQSVLYFGDLSDIKTSASPSRTTADQRLPNSNICLSCFSIFGSSVLIIKNRLKGVDPFGITTFCWVFAAFILLVAKSVYVENLAMAGFSTTSRRMSKRYGAPLSDEGGGARHHYLPPP